MNTVNIVTEFLKNVSYCTLQDNLVVTNSDIMFPILEKKPCHLLPFLYLRVGDFGQFFKEAVLFSDLQYLGPHY